jgi:hypothetical protein
VLVSVEVSTPDDAAVIAEAMRLACADDVTSYDAEDDSPAMVTASFSETSLARLAH